jgi:hypothetical protein
MPLILIINGENERRLISTAMTRDRMGMMRPCAKNL